MIGRTSLIELLRRAVASSGAAETEVTAQLDDLAVTRWNRNQIHQNLSRLGQTLTVRVIDEGRVGLATTNDLTPAAASAAAARALRFARLQRPNPEAPRLPVPAWPAQPEVTAAFVAPTAAFSAGDRADACGVVITAAQGANLMSAGTFATSAHETAIVNSLGVEAYHRGTKAFVRTIVNDGDLTGYADQLSPDVGELDVAGLAGEAISKATLHRAARELPAGRYDTVFEPVALADLIRFLGYLAFGAKAVQEGRSFMGPYQGQQAMSELVTIWDDGSDPRTIASPFDAEGVPRQKVTLIDRGVVQGPVYDSATAAKEGRPSTGHASPPGRYLSGPLPRNMLMEAGAKSRAEIIRSTAHGVLVTRFHYTHAPEPMRVVATGTTRDGTFLIKDGELVARLKNLRFTDSTIDAFSRIDAVSADARLARDWWSTFESYLPAVRVAGFTFTGGTTF